MRKKFYLNLGIFVVLTVLLASCWDIEDDEPAQERTLESEMELLSTYLDTLEQRGIDIDTTALGVYYIVQEVGEGAFPAIGDTVEVMYSGYFLDGELFDASTLYDPEGTYELVLGTTPVIDGWTDGLQVINKNAKVQLIIPSTLAYGSNGYSSIPPYETLRFAIEMKDIRPY